MGVTPTGKMGSWSCAMVLPASLAPAFPPRNCPFLVQSIFLASHKLPPHFRMSDPVPALDLRVLRGPVTATGARTRPGAGWPQWRSHSPDLRSHRALESKQKTTSRVDL